MCRYTMVLQTNQIKIDTTIIAENITFKIVLKRFSRFARVCSAIIIDLQLFLFSFAVKNSQQMRAASEQKAFLFISVNFRKETLRRVNYAAQLKM